MRISNVSAALMVVLLAGCSSFDGQPTPIFGVDDMRNIVKTQYPLDKTLEDYNAITPNNEASLERKLYRNKVVAIYLAAMDASYQNFLIALSKQNKSGNLSLSTAALGFSSAATLTAGTAAQILSASSAVATGSQASFNSTLFYEKTLPAIVASMEASRSEIKAVILRNLKQPADKYPLEMAIAHLQQYQDAASLDHAIQRMTNSAGQDAKTANTRVLSTQ